MTDTITVEEKWISSAMVRTARLIVFSLLGVVILIRLLHIVSLNEIFQTLLTGNVKTILCSLVVGTGAQVINGHRIKLCLKGKYKASTVTTIAAVHQMMVNILPFRSGEFTFIILVRKYLLCTAEESVTALGTIRFGDILAGLLFSLVAYIIAVITNSSMVVPLIVLLVLMSVMVIGGYSFITKGGPSVKKIIRLQEHGSSKIRKSIVKTLHLLNNSTTGIHQRLSTKLLLLTLVYWSLNILQAWGIFCAFYHIDFTRYFILFTISTLASIAPIHGFLNVGTNEGIHVLTVIKSGFDMRIALSTAIGCHILTLFSTILFGGIGWIMLQLQSLTIERNSVFSTKKCSTDSIKKSTSINNTTKV
jgi:hypothetical protein